MATYTIIGGDGKEYGSVLGEDLRRWIAEGRLNAQSLVKAAGDAEFRPLSTFPEFADAFASQATAPGTPPVFSTGSIAEGDYDVDIGGCISRGWNLFKENFGILFVPFLIMCALLYGAMYALGQVTAPLSNDLMQTPIAVQVGFKYLFPVVTSLVIGPLMGGLYFVYLKVIRGQEAGAGDAFAGFKKAKTFGELYLGALVVGLIVGACLLPFTYVWQVKAGPVLEQLQLQVQMARLLAPNDTEKIAQIIFHDLMPVFIGALPVLLICLIPTTYLTVCWGFTLPLIIDREMKFWSAMKTSFKMVNKHWWQLFGLTVLVGLLNGVGGLACCIGALFTAPIGIAATMYAYETIFSRPQTG
jgi:hypothetical protein